AVFSMIGARPCTDWLPAEIERDDKGFIKTGVDIAEAPAWSANKRRPAALETSLPGIFAAGDVRSGSVKRCAAAVGEGGMAAAENHHRHAYWQRNSPAMYRRLWLPLRRQFPQPHTESR